MTDTPPPLLPDDLPRDELLAAELALRLLDGDEEAAAQARAASDAAFAEKVQRWQETFARMAEDLTPVLAPARAKVAIDRSLGHGKPLRIAEPARAAGGFARWLMGTLAAGAVAVMALIWLPPLWQTAPTPAPMDYASNIAAHDMRVSAKMSSIDHMLEVEMQGGSVPQGRDYQLWWIAAEGAAPVSLGLIPRDGSMARMPMPEGLAPGAAVRLAVSDEPEGGSPTGRPTGEVMADAPLTEI